MKTIYFVLLMLLMSFSVSIKSFCQDIIDPDDPQGIIEQEINNAVNKTFGVDYRAAFDVLDSTFVRKQGTSPNSVFEDPQNLLKGYILFVADKGNVGDLKHGAMGLYKDGAIIWHTDPILHGIGGGVFSIKDINNDEKIEILYEWYPESDITVRYLWIISWDGANGKLLNDVDNKKGNTTILAAESRFDLIEDISTHICKIRAQWADSDDANAGYFPKIQLPSLPFVTYVWNGSKYVLGTESGQIPRTTFFPANQFTVTVNSSASKTLDSLTYEYTLKNSASSKQTIIKFLLNPIAGNILLKSPDNWLSIANSNLAIGLWSIKDLITNHGGILPGQSKRNFTIMSIAPPAITKYYTQGNRPYTQFTKDEIGSSAFKQIYINDLLTNSVNGFTIGPNQAVSTLSGSNLLDTMISYAHQSVTLGWLAQKKDLDTSNGESAKDSIATNLIKRLQAIKTTLQQGDSVGAHTLLQNFLNKVNAEHARSTNRMSDECYALLRYSGEYLRDKLPSQ